MKIVYILSSQTRIFHRMLFLYTDESNNLRLVEPARSVFFLFVCNSLLSKYSFCSVHHFFCFLGLLHLPRRNSTLYTIAYTHHVLLVRGVLSVAPPTGPIGVAYENAFFAVLEPNS
jgi:hypothetical protein